MSDCLEITLGKQAYSAREFMTGLVEGRASSAADQSRLAANGFIARWRFVVARLMRFAQLLRSQADLSIIEVLTVTLAFCFL